MSSEAAEPREAVEIESGDPSTETTAERIARDFQQLFHSIPEHTWASASWRGVPMWKYPTDLIVIQEIVSEVAPELIVEAGVWSGGSALFFADLLELAGGDGRVVAIDVDLSNVAESVRSHPRIELVESSSTDPVLLARLRREAEGRRVLVDLDSDHSSGHVLEELRGLSPLVSPGSYLIVEDSAVGGRPIDPDHGAGPAEAIEAWMAEEPPFEADLSRERMLLTLNPGGYLRRLDAGEAVAEPVPIAPPEPVTPSGPRPIPDAAALLSLGPRERELASLRHAVWKLAAEERRLRAEFDASRRQIEAAGVKMHESLLAEITRQQQLLVEKDKRLRHERNRRIALERSLPVRLKRRLGRLPLVRSLPRRRG